MQRSIDDLITDAVAEPLTSIPLGDTGVLLPSPDTNEAEKDVPEQTSPYPNLKDIEKPPEKYSEKLDPSVNKKAFIALVVGQMAMNHANEKMFPHRSDNQLSSLEKPGGKSAPKRIRISRYAADWASNSSDFDQAKHHDMRGIVGQYYGAADCGENAAGTYAWLSKYLPPDYTVSHVVANSNLADHEYTMIWWKEQDASGKKSWCSNPVAIDAEFAGQAFLFSHFHWNPAHYENNVNDEIAKKPYYVVKSYTQPSDVHEILHSHKERNEYEAIGDTFGNTASNLNQQTINFLELLPPCDSIKDMDDKNHESYKASGAIGKETISDMAKPFKIIDRAFSNSNVKFSLCFKQDMENEPSTFIYRTSTRIGPHLGNFIDYTYDDTGNTVKFSQLCTIDPNKPLEDGNRLLWSAELPPILAPDKTTNGTKLLDLTRRFRGEKDFERNGSERAASRVSSGSILLQSITPPPPDQGNSRQSQLRR